MTNPRTPLASLSDDDLAGFLAEQRSAYASLKSRGLKLDLTRGKPSAAQLDLANDLLHLPTSTKDRNGVDVRNYGGLEGLAELREIFAELLWVEPSQVVAGGNSSLTMMYSTIVDFLLFGGVDSPRPWSQEEKVRFICPVPGYDRHFSMLASFGIEMVTVDMHQDGPDMAAVESLVRDDPSIKGIWIVPTYANPSGAVVSHEVAARLAAMPTAAPDFTIFWDNAYAFHHLTEDEAKSADILSLCAASGHPNRPIMYASTSKITFAGAGVAVLAASEANVKWYLGAPRDGLDRTRQGEPPASRRVLPRRRRGPGAHAAAPRDHRAEVRRGRRGPDDRARRSRRRRVEPPDRRLLRQPRRARRHRLTGRRPRQGGRHRAHARRRVLPAGQRPARPQHPPRADLPGARRGAHGHGRRRHLRRPRRRREADARARRAGRGRGDGATASERDATNPATEGVSR